MSTIHQYTILISHDLTELIMLEFFKVGFKFESENISLY
jgi:hypothetical protein